MNLQDKHDHYGVMSLFLHWVSAGIILLLVYLGNFMTDLPDGDDKWFWYSLHKSFGVLLFTLLVIRIIWWFSKQKNIVSVAAQGLQKWLMRFVHFGLYCMMLLITLSGYVDSSAGGYHIAFFKLFDIPLVVGKNEALGHLATEAHQYAVYVLLILLALHLTGVLVHQMWKRDTVLYRMIPASSLKKRP